MKTLYFTFVSLLLIGGSLQAQNTGNLRERMEERLPEIVEMRSAQLIGENNQAYLSVLGELNEQQSLVIQQENADRRTVYTMLARQTGASLEMIQKRRAEQIREQAVTGTMIQTEDGDWVKKQ